MNAKLENMNTKLENDILQYFQIYPLAGPSVPNPIYKKSFILDGMV